MSGWLARSVLLDEGADGDAAGVTSDFVETDVVDVDEGGGMLDVVLHEVDEVGAAAEELGVVSERMEGGFGGGGAFVGEGVHAAPPSETARTAATMLG